MNNRSKQIKAEKEFKNQYEIMDNYLDHESDNESSKVVSDSDYEPEVSEEESEDEEVFDSNECLENTQVSKGQEDDEDYEEDDEDYEEGDEDYEDGDEDYEEDENYLADDEDYSDEDSEEDEEDEDSEEDEDYEEDEDSEEDEYSEEDEDYEEENVKKMNKKNMYSCIDYIKARNKNGVINYVNNFGSTVIVKGTTKADREWVYSDLNGIIDAKWNEYTDNWCLNSVETLSKAKQTKNVVYTYDVDKEKSVFETSITSSGRNSKAPNYFISSIIPPPVKKTRTHSDSSLIENIWKNDEVDAIRLSGDSVIAELKKIYDANDFNINN
tara:strand:+ start:3406 stop:4383 length:978 start_codon:yes stop_codon:yes gene_type:complete